MESVFDKLMQLKRKNSSEYFVMIGVRVKVRIRVAVSLRNFCILVATL